MDRHRHPRHPFPAVGTFPLGKPVVSAHDGARIGKLVDVRVDTLTLVPRWLVVDPGPLRAPRFVPVHDAYRSADDTLVVPFTKAIVNHSPHFDGELTHELAVELREYYQLVP